MSRSFSPGEISYNARTRKMADRVPAVNRLRDPSHWPTLKLLDRALKAVGKELVITVRNREKRA
jgi:hypothetical protein